MCSRFALVTDFLDLFLSIALRLAFALRSRCYFVYGIGTHTSVRYQRQRALPALLVGASCELSQLHSHVFVFTARLSAMYEDLPLVTRSFMCPISLVSSQALD